MRAGSERVGEKQDLIADPDCWIGMSGLAKDIATIRIYYRLICLKPSPVRKPYRSRSRSAKILTMN